MSFFDFLKEAPKEKKRKAIRDVNSTVQKITTRLNRIHSQKTTGNSRISQEKMDRYCATIKLLADEIGRATPSEADIQIIDDSILRLVMDLETAIASGSENTVERILKALHFGISQARKDIDSADTFRIAGIIDERVRRLADYESIVYLSLKMDRTIITQEAQNQILEHYKVSFEANKNSLEKASATRPDLVRELENSCIDEDALSSGARALLTGRKLLIAISQNIENLVRQQELNDITIQHLQDTISILESQMAQADTFVEDENL